MNIAFNPNYILKPDRGRVLLLPKDSIRTYEGVSNNSFDGFIHPIHAMILSFAKGNNKDDVIKGAAEYLQINENFVRNFIEPLIKNKEPYAVIYKNVVIQFPANTLIETNNYSGKIYNPEDFQFEELDLKLKRHLTPSRITLMVNNKCITNCLYCYADRNNKIDCKIPFNKMIKIINEAVKLNVINIDVSGGEFFLYKHWKELLSILLKNEFTPFISTKMPIKENDIIFLKNINVPDLQISLDTLIPNNLIRILDVNKNYITSIKDTLILLNKHNIKTIIHTILNSKNDSIEDIDSIYQFIKEFSNIDYWRIDLAGESLYLNKKFEEYKYNPSNLVKIKEYLENKSKEAIFKIKHDSIQTAKENTNNTYDLEFFTKRFNKRAICSGNYSNLYILPDGKVTICEELYWHPTFIIGDINKQSIEEIWNSKKALDLFYFPKSKIPKDSACFNCKQYESCRPIPGICWRDIIKKFGKDKWYYPDDRCPITFSDKPLNI